MGNRLALGFGPHQAGQTFGGLRGAQAGFTLIELMIVVIIAFLLMIIGVPSFLQTIRDNSMRADLQKLWSSASLARSEAIKRNSNVLVCPLNSAQDNCVETSVWTGGWVVFVDRNDNATIDGNIDAARDCEHIFGADLTGDCVLQVEERPITGPGRTLTSVNVGFIAYNGLGSTSLRSSRLPNQFLLCDSATEDADEAIKYARKLVLSGSGRPRMEKAGNTDTCSF